MGLVLGAWVALAAIPAGAQAAAGLRQLSWSRPAPS